MSSGASQDIMPKESTPPKKGKEEKIWYVLSVNSRGEEKIAELIMKRAKAQGCDRLIDEVLCPMEKRSVMRRGKKVNVERRLLPGYLLIKMLLTEETICLVKEVPGVRTFLGAQEPHSIPGTEVVDVHKWAEGKAERIFSDTQYVIGQEVRVISGPFASFNGVVETVDVAHAKLKVGVSIFGRLTPVELEYGQVEKI